MLIYPLHSATKQIYIPVFLNHVLACQFFPATTGIMSWAEPKEVLKYGISYQAGDDNYSSVP